MPAPFIERNLRRRVRPAVKLKWAPQLSLYSTSAPAISVPDVEQEKRGRSTWSKLLLFIPGAITLGLGTWQIFRRQENLQSPVLVDRGWVPRSWRDKALDVSEDDRLSSDSSTTPTRHCKNFLVAVLWFYVDAPAIARACGLSEKALYMEAINDNIKAISPYPVPKHANALSRSSVMPQDRLNYTLTWYSLSAAVTYTAIKRLRPRKRGRY